MGFMMFKNVSPVIMHLLSSLYGSEGFVKAFGKNAVSISLLSLFDHGNMATFTGAVDTILPVPDPPLVNEDEAKEKRKQQRVLLKKMAEEESLVLYEDLFMCHVTENTPPLIKAEIGNLFSQASKSSIWKDSKTLKEYKLLSALAEKEDDLFNNECKELQKKYEIG
jgi:hypothetical protein